MAIVKQSRICPFCRANLTSIPESETLCPICGKSTKIPKTNYFGLPDYLRLQMDSLLKEGGPDKIKPEDSRYEIMCVAAEEELTNLIRECSDMDRIASLCDAQKMLAEVMHSNAGFETIQVMISISKRIGKLAEAMDSFFKAGGQVNDRKAGWVSTTFGDEDGNQAAASASWDQSR